VRAARTAAEACVGLLGLSDRLAVVTLPAAPGSSTINFERVDAVKTLAALRPLWGRAAAPVNADAPAALEAHASSTLAALSQVGKPAVRGVDFDGRRLNGMEPTRERLAERRLERTRRPVVDHDVLAAPDGALPLRRERLEPHLLDEPEAHPAHERGKAEPRQTVGERLIATWTPFWSLMVRSRSARDSTSALATADTIARNNRRGVKVRDRSACPVVRPS
jgi:hypothetical protein